MISIKLIITAIALAFASLTKTALATNCGIEYYLWNADTNNVVDKLPYNIDLNHHNYTFSIEARPTGDCYVESAYLKLSGPLSYTRVENYGPYLLFGDYDNEVDGHWFNEGWYTIYSKLYTKDNLDGRKVASRYYKFQVTS
jgi:hypothetical protein